LMAQSRILYAMALDGMVPAIFGKLHPRYRTPAIGTIVGASLAALVAASLSITLLSQMVSIGALFAFTTVAAGVLVLRVRHPQVSRSFRVAWVPAIPLAAIAVCAYLMVSLPVGTWMRFCVWVLCGLLIYSVYGRRAERKGAIY
jgi:basic amino acid/polyamine antiporter, APA family